MEVQELGTSPVRHSLLFPHVGSRPQLGHARGSQRPGPSTTPHLRQKEGRACKGPHCPLGWGRRWGGVQWQDSSHLVAAAALGPHAPQADPSGIGGHGLQLGKGTLQATGATAQPSPFPPGQARLTSLHQRKLETTDALEKQPLKIITTTRAPSF